MASERLSARQELLDHAAGKLPFLDRTSRLGMG